MIFLQKLNHDYMDKLKKTDIKKKTTIIKPEYYISSSIIFSTVIPSASAL